MLLTFQSVFFIDVGCQAELIVTARHVSDCVMSQTENGAVMSRGLHSLLHSDSDLLFTSTPCRPQDLTARYTQMLIAVHAHMHADTYAHTP